MIGLQGRVYAGATFYGRLLATALVLFCQCVLVVCALVVIGQYVVIDGPKCRNQTCDCLFWSWLVESTDKQLKILPDDLLILWLSCILQCSDSFSNGGFCGLFTFYRIWWGFILSFGGCLPGLFLTYVALNVMNGNGQPALLYIVPCTLGMLHFSLGFEFLALLSSYDCWGNHFHTCEPVSKITCFYTKITIM